VNKIFIVTLIITTSSLNAMNHTSSQPAFKLNPHQVFLVKNLHLAQQQDTPPGFLQTASVTPSQPKPQSLVTMQTLFQQATIIKEQFDISLFLNTHGADDTALISLKTGQVTIPDSK